MSYPLTIRSDVEPAGTRPGCRTISGMCIMPSKADRGRVWSLIPQRPFWPPTHPWSAA